MCGRYSLGLSWEQLVESWHLASWPVEPHWTPRWNIAPGQDILALGPSKEGETKAAWVRWGYPLGNRLLINARCESLTTKPLFHEAMKSQRTVIPADGFYEWAPDRRAFRFTAQVPLSIAGLLLRSRQEPIWRVVLITCPANRWVGDIHDRMPWLLTPEQVPLWLDRHSTQYRTLSATELPLTRYAVSSRLNSAQEDTPDLVLPMPES
ncbi:hypothetical protein BXT84_12525 [Sulfobacillus thermotolerans]|uniref:Abasic site processing protein n=1 Tax=Sulfobacillus thermotolerans TaxID=338644 RepID=A0ABM6RTL7_9FIRM|nr:hypothetical protein BXT84_12525 [Sulfobacillus thermotolerans]